MSGMFSPKTPKANKPTPVAGLQVQSSSYGLPVALRYGRNRCAGQLMDYTGFRSVEHATKQKSGGKGGSKSTTQYSYTYNVTFLLALGEGGSTYTVNRVWKEKEVMTLAKAGFTLFTGAPGQLPWSYMQTKFPTRALAYANTAYLAAADLDLGDSPTIANYNFDVSGLLHQTGKSGAKPKDIITDYLTNSTHGAGFNFLATLTGSQFDNYCLARGIYLSPFEETQRPAANFIKEMAETCNSAIVWSQNKLSFIPYGDEQIVGADGTYTPDLTPVFAIGPDDYRTKSGDNGGYVHVERKPLERAYNQVSIECRDKDRDYNTTVVSAEDQADIDARGARPKAVTKMEHIVDPELARDVAQIMMMRDLYVSRTFTFDLTIRHSLLDLMDLITITDPVNQLFTVLARVVGITEEADGLLIEAEEVLANAASAPRYTTQNSEGFLPDFGVDPGSTNEPVLINAPALLTPTGYELWIAADSANANWGGAQVWLSYDNAEYMLVGVLPGPSRIGTLNASTGSMAGDASVIIDNTNTVDVTIRRGVLIGGTDDDRDEFRTLSYLESAGGEFFSFKTATLTAALRYTLASLRREAYGTEANAHAAGTRYVRLDDCIFRLPYDPGDDGKTVYIKLPSFNVYGQGQQDLASATAYSIVLRPNRADAPLRTTDLGGRGVNLLPDQYSVYDNTALPVFYGPSGMVATRDTGTKLNAELASLKLARTSASVGDIYFTPGNPVTAPRNIAFRGTKRFIVSFMMYADTFTGGDILCAIANGVSESPQTAITLVDGAGGAAWSRYACAIDCSALAAVDYVSLRLVLGASTTSKNYFITDIMVEEQLGRALTPSVFARGSTNKIALDALIAAAASQAAADGNIDIFRQTTAPSHPPAKLGDYWQDTSVSGKGRWMVSNGTTWGDASDTRIPEALTNAANAQTTADGKNRIHYSETQPASGFQLYDLWVKPSTKEVYQYNGTGWSKIAEDSSAHITRYVTNPSFELPLTVGWGDAGYGGGITGWYTEATGAFTGTSKLVKFGGVTGSSGIFQAPGNGGVPMPVGAGQRVAITYTALANGGPSGELILGLAYYNAAGSLISGSYGAGETGRLTSASFAAANTWQSFRRVVTTPANCASVRLVIAVHGYTGTGAWAIDNVAIAPQLQNLDELPNGTTNSSVLTSQVQNGVLPPYSFGDEIVVNGSFENGLAGGGASGVNTLGAIMADGWEIVERGGAAPYASIESAGAPYARTGLRSALIGNFGGEVCTPGNNYLIVGMKQQLQVSPGERFVVRYGLRDDFANAIPANMIVHHFVGMRFYNSAGGYVGQFPPEHVSTPSARTVNSNSMLTTSGRYERVATAPAGAATARPLYYLNFINTSGGNITLPYAVSHMRLDDFSIKRLTVTGSSPNMLNNTEFSRGTTGWGNAGSIVVAQDTRRMEYTPANDTVYHFPFQDITYGVTVGAEYSGSVEVGFAGISGNAYANLQVQFYDVSNTMLASFASDTLTPANAPTSNRMRLEVAGATAPANTSYVRWILVIRGPGTFQFLKAKLERGLLPTAYMADASAEWGTELTHRGSRRLIGGPRNLTVSQTMGPGSVRTATALTANSSGQVSVAAHSVELNGETVSYSAVTNAVTGLTQGVTYVIYTLDPYADGGTRTWYAASTILAAQTAGEGPVVAGNVKIPTSGSSSGGQGGTGGPGSWCVDYDTMLPDGRYLRDLRTGDLVQCVDVNTGEVGMFPLLSMGYGEADCFRLTTADLASVIQSRDTVMDIPGNRTKTTPEMFGQQVYQIVNGERKLSFVCDLQHLGVRRVLKPDLGNRMFFAGETADATLATHNAQYKP